MDFSYLSGSFGQVVTSVTQNEETKEVTTKTGDMGGNSSTRSGAKGGFNLALSLIPSVMLALAMVNVFEYYGALRAAEVLMSHVLRFLLGIPGYCGLALIASLQSTDAGAGLTKTLDDNGTLTRRQKHIFAAFQFSAGSAITNFFSASAVVFTLRAEDGSLLMPVSMGVVFLVIFLSKFIGANIVRLIIKENTK